MANKSGGKPSDRRAGKRKDRNQRMGQRVPELGYYLIVTDTCLLYTSHLSIFDAVNRICEMNDCIRYFSDIDPVSYTHLDVYKRQDPVPVWDI